jgi:hypothetical protein
VINHSFEQLHCRSVATWRCPHCGTPQADSTRCWVCSKSPTTCSSCRHFHHGVAAGIGLCALDRTRSPIRADDVRACWQGPEFVEPPKGLFAMVEALEATTAIGQAKEEGEQESGEGASGLDRLRRLVFSGRPADWVRPQAANLPAQVVADQAADPAAPMTADKSRDQQAIDFEPDNDDPLARDLPGPPIPLRAPRPMEPEFVVGPPPPAGGQLHDAEPVTPGLRLSYRGDARTLRAAAVAASNQRTPGAGTR